MTVRFTDSVRVVDEDAYLRDFIKAVEHKDMKYIQFVVPIIRAQKKEVLQSQSRNGTTGGYFDVATEDCSRYDYILAHGLLTASRSGEVDVVKYLVAEGVNINAQNEDGDTALIKACERGNADVVKFLLSCPQIDVNVTNMVGSSALHSTARFSERWNIVDLLLDVPSIDLNLTAHKRGKSPLHAAAEQDSSGCIVRSLLDRGAHVNVLDLDGRVPLHEAASRGLVTNVALLLRYGAYPNITDARLNVTPLHEGAKNGHAEVVMMLVTAGANPEARDRSHRTALQIIEVQVQLSSKTQGYADSRRFLINDADRVKLQEKHRLLRVFDKLSPLIGCDSWLALFVALFGGDERHVAQVVAQVPCCPSDASLTVLVHFLLHRWLLDLPQVATFWTLMRALRDHGMPQVADQMIETFLE